MLANEAVSADRQAQIVEYGGLRLLVPLTKSVDHDVRRLAAHALANLSVNTRNQTLMADEGAVEMLLDLLESDNEVRLSLSCVYVCVCVCVSLYMHMHAH